MIKVLQLITEIHNYLEYARYVFGINGNIPKMMKRRFVL
jgi:hypothetical protein